MLVGQQAAVGADVAGVDRQRVERRLRERREAGVRRDRRVAVVAVVEALAAREVGILAGRGVAVEGLDGGGQGIDGHADLLGEPGDGVGGAQDRLDARAEAPVEGRRAGEDRAERVLAAVARVEHEPGRHRAARRGALRHEPAGDMVGGRLVAETLAGAVHHDRPGQRTLDEHRPRAVLVGELVARGPPRRVEVRHLHAEAHRGLRGGAAVEGIARGPGGGGGARQVLGAQRRVALEAARGEDHAARGADALRLAVAEHLGTDHAPALDDEARELRRQLHRHLALAQRHAQPRDERAATRQPTVAVRLPALPHVEVVLGGDLHEGALGALRLRDERVRLARRPVDAAEGRGTDMRRLQQVELAAERVAGDGQRLAAAVARAAAGQLRVIVAILGEALELHLGALVQPAEHARRVLDEGADALRRGELPGERGDVALGIDRRVAAARGADEVVVRDPDGAARGGGGAAEEMPLLDDEHLGALVRGGERGGETARAAAHHQHIGLHFREGDAHEMDPQEKRTDAPPSASQSSSKRSPGRAVSSGTSEPERMMSPASSVTP